MKIKTSGLQGVALDWAVAKCLGHEVVENYVSYIRIYLTDPKQAGYALTFCPSTDWAHGGPIIEREKLGVWWATHYVDDDGVEYGNHWYCETGCTDDNYDSQHIATGPTPLIAAMRCYVASKLGDEVEVPDELLT